MEKANVDTEVNLHIPARIALSALIILVALLLYRLVTIKPLKPKPFFKANHPLVIAHRGGAGLAPENTILAFQNAYHMGVDVLEMDVHLTRDGHLVVIHDSTVDRTTNGHGRVRDMTLAEIKSLDAGYRFSTDGGKTFPFRGKGVTIPTLEEVLSAFPDARLNIEIKPDDERAADKLVELIKAHHAENRVLVLSFHSKPLSRFRALLPDAATAASKNEITLFWVMDKLYMWRIFRPKPDALQIPVRWGRYHIYSPRFVRDAHRMGMEVHVWTVDDPQEMKRLLDDGVDGIITNRPDLLMKVLQRNVSLTRPSG
jgi:glycerophosphoryl diester phosphodiesterase